MKREDAEERQIIEKTLENYIENQRTTLVSITWGCISTGLDYGPITHWPMQTAPTYE